MTPKIQNILTELQKARTVSAQFAATSPLDGHERKPTDLFAMSLAYDEEKRLEAEYNLALAEEESELARPDEIEYWKSEQERLTKRIRAWQSGQFPSTRYAKEEQQS
jgi:hypothetical protein